jgi:hypothetical protein
VTNYGNRLLLLDLRVTSCFPPNGRVLSQRDIDDPDFCKKNLTKNFDEKNSQYATAATNAGWDFLPCVIDIGGQMHSGFRDLLKKVVKKASEAKNIPFKILWQYWFSAIMVTLVQGRTKAIVGLTSKTFGVQLPETYDLSDQVVSRSSYVNCG